MYVNPIWNFQVNTYIEDRIPQKEKLIKILRLMCMQSVCNNGLKQKVLEYYKREIFQVTSKVSFWMWLSSFIARVKTNQVKSIPRIIWWKKKSAFYNFEMSV